MKLNPKACLIAAAFAIHAEEFDVARDHLDDYAWLRERGDVPSPTIHGVEVWRTGLIGSKLMTCDGDSFFSFLCDIL